MANTNLALLIILISNTNELNTPISGRNWENLQNIIKLFAITRDTLHFRTQILSE